MHDNRNRSQMVEAVPCVYFTLFDYCPHVNASALLFSVALRSRNFLTGWKNTKIYFPGCLTKMLMTNTAKCTPWVLAKRWFHTFLQRHLRRPTFLSCWPNRVRCFTVLFIEIFSSEFRWFSMCVIDSSSTGCGCGSFHFWGKSVLKDLPSKQSSGGGRPGRVSLLWSALKMNRNHGNVKFKCRLFSSLDGPKGLSCEWENIFELESTSNHAVYIWSLHNLSLSLSLLYYIFIYLFIFLGGGGGGGLKKKKKITKPRPDTEVEFCRKWVREEKWGKNN